MPRPTRIIFALQLTHEGEIVSREHLRILLSDLFAEELTRSAGSAIDRHAGCAMLEAALLGLLDWWQADGARLSPRETAALFRQFAGYRPL